MFFKNIQKNLSPFYVKKTIKESPVPLDISIKSNRIHHKTVLYSKSTKTWLGDILGNFLLSLGNFFTKTSGHPENKLECFSVASLDYSCCQHYKTCLLVTYILGI